MQSINPNSLLNKILKKFGLRALPIATYREWEQLKPLGEEMAYLLELKPSQRAMHMQYKQHSTSQRWQDLFVLGQLNFKRNGYFVDFGASDGVFLSNSYLLEKEFGWKGIVAEPGKFWHADLEKNRAVYIETDCLWSVSGDTLTFNEVESPTLSTIDNFSKSDNHSTLRETGKKYAVTTISLDDMLAKHNAPAEIDYLSIDTEGSEYAILSHFDFTKYKIKVITVEHNYTPLRDKLYVLLTSHGYERVFEKYSAFDDWYILK